MSLWEPRRSKQELVFSEKLDVNRKVQAACEGLLNNDQKLFLELPESDKLLVADFLIDCYNRQNSALKSRRAYLTCLVYLSRYHKGKPFNTMTRDEIFGYLNSLHRPAGLDPDQKWINTHNQRAMVYSKFWKWFSQPDLKPEEREMPEILKGMSYHRKKEKTSVQAKDLWTAEDDAVFLKYCEDPRISCWHTMARDTSARPHEQLALRIGDVKVKTTPAGKMYAEVEIGRGGKTKSRTVPLIDSLPYFKAWLAKHPMTGDSSAFLFISFENSSKYGNVPLKTESLNNIYSKLKMHYFPKLLERADVPPEDKIKISELLKKPWNLYIRRHTSLTEKARMINEYSMRLHAGWSKSSKMVEIYTHELGGESSKDLLAAYGIINPHEEQSNTLLQPKYCPHCKEANKRDAKFCTNCQMVLTFDGYSEIIEEKQNKDKVIAKMQNDISEIAALYKQLHEEIRK